MILFLKVGGVIDPVTVGISRVGAGGVYLEGRWFAVGGPQVGEDGMLSAPC